MSIQTAMEPVSALDFSHPGVEAVIDVRSTTIDGFPVGRVLPSVTRRSVGPFVFLDHIGPVDVTPGHGLDVRPHPHIHLATVTYLFDGEIQHRDSLGSLQVIRPGAVNWMSAGRGIVHSERTPLALRESGFRMHGVQLWVALPAEHEDADPTFVHYPPDILPQVVLDNAHIRVLAGTAFGVESPISTLSRVLLAEVKLQDGARLNVPQETEVAAFVIGGSVTCGSLVADAGRLLVFSAGSNPLLRAAGEAHVLIIGGEPLGPRHMFWNFVSSTSEAIERAKRDWQDGKFPKVPGDEREFVPLPQNRHK